jgi:hypothetical protein
VRAKAYLKIKWLSIPLFIVVVSTFSTGLNELVLYGGVLFGFTLTGLIFLYLFEKAVRTVESPDTSE